VNPNPASVVAPPTEIHASVTLIWFARRPTLPDPTFQTVSSTEVSALFGHNTYYTLWMLWHCFRLRDRSMIEADPNDDRVRWGKLLQPVILQMTAEKYRLDIIENTANEYARRGPLGATIDAHVAYAPDQGTVIVEAKNIDWLRWKQTWTETLSTQYVELQTQVAMHVKGAERGIIAAFVGGNDLRFYERRPIPDIIGDAIARATYFLEDVKAGNEPDPLMSPLESPVLAALYPQIEPTKVHEDYDDEELALAIRGFGRARADESFAQKLKDQHKVAIITKADGAGIVRANGWTAFVKRVEVSESICKPHAEPKVVKKASAQIRIDVEETTPRERAVPADNNVLGI
jgi:hypothetical protein